MLAAEIGSSELVLLLLMLQLMFPGCPPGRL